jgi:hypothetical protein
MQAPRPGSPLSRHRVMFFSMNALIASFGSKTQRIK